MDDRNRLESAATQGGKAEPVEEHAFAGAPATVSSAGFGDAMTVLASAPGSGIADAAPASGGRAGRLCRTPAGSAAPAPGGDGLRDGRPAGPARDEHRIGGAAGLRGRFMLPSRSSACEDAPDASGGAGLRGRAGCRRGLPDDGGGAAAGMTVTVRWEVERVHARVSGSEARGLYMSRRSGGGVAGALPMPCLQRAGGKKDARFQAGGAGSVQEPASIAGACRIACRAAVSDDASPQSGVCEAGRPWAGWIPGPDGATG